MVRSAARPSRDSLLLAWYVGLAGLDVLCTSAILLLGGIEVNALAARVLDAAGVPGLAGLKIATVVIVLACWRAVRARSAAAASHLAEWCVILGAVPVVLGASQLALVAAGVITPIVR
ncbi:MAG: hypothetical protein IT439_10535 [Phycisphaerales bacterium]|nr:hypothetical protein [Phycisphaerales bacterium]